MVSSPSDILERCPLKSPDNSGDKHKGIKCFFLTGPTAVGKTSVAQIIAARTGYPILSADSMLVYNGMDIGTAKPSLLDRDAVTYFGMDIVEPDRLFSVRDYVDYVRSVVANGSEVIVVGGTGLYLSSLINGLKDLPGPNPELRECWGAIVTEHGVVPLQIELMSKYPELYAGIQDKQNPRRLIRALEIAESGGAGKHEGGRVTYDPAVKPVALTMPVERLNARIESRVSWMYANGFIDEVKRLMADYPALSTTAMQSIGYKEAMDFIQGSCTIEDAMSRSAGRTRRLAKRQMTWFRHQLDIHSIEVASDVQISETVRSVEEFWAKTGPMEIEI